MASAIMNFVQRFNTLQQQRDTSDELIKVLPFFYLVAYD
jgi:hypothetical protein